MGIQYGRSVHRPHAELRVVIDKRARFGLGAAPAGVWPGSLTDRKNAFVGLKEIAGSAHAGVVSKAHPKSAYGRNFDDFGAVTAGFASPCKNANASPNLIPAAREPWDFSRCCFAAVLCCCVNYAHLGPNLGVDLYR